MTEAATGVERSGKTGALLGFRSGKLWHRACALAFFAALYAAFALTMFPPVAAGNRDVLVYKAIRIVLFAIPVLVVLFLSDFEWRRRIPLFSSERRSQRLLGAATLSALLLCLCANMTYLHTPEYREALRDLGASLVAGPADEAPPAPGEASSPILEADEPPSGESSADDSQDEGLEHAWNDRREGCGTD